MKISIFLCFTIVMLIVIYLLNNPITTLAMGLFWSGAFLITVVNEIVGD